MGVSNESYFGESGGGEYEGRDGEFECRQCGGDLEEVGDGYCYDCRTEMYEAERRQRKAREEIEKDKTRRKQ